MRCARAASKVSWTVESILETGAEGEELSGAVATIERWRDVFLALRDGPGPPGPGVPGPPGVGRSAVDTATLALTLLIALLVVIDRVTRR